MTSAPLVRLAGGPVGGASGARGAERERGSAPMGPPRTPYTIRQKGFASNAWSAVRTSAATAVATDTTFRLWGASRDLPLHLLSIERIDWNAHDLIGWPDGRSIYERAREPTHVMEGVTRWHRRDASAPMDLVLGRDSRLVAAIDPRGDIVLVRRGYEAFTTVVRWKGRAFLRHDMDTAR